MEEGACGWDAVNQDSGNANSGEVVVRSRHDGILDLTLRATGKPFLSKALLKRLTCAGSIKLDYYPPLI